MSVALPEHCSFHRNCVFASSDGLCITRLAGGDFDGDLVMLSWNRKLINFFRRTKRADEVLATGKALHKQLERSLEEDLNADNPDPDVQEQIRMEKGRSYTKCTATTAWDLADDYLEYACQIETPELKGSLCAKFERSAGVVMQTPDMWTNHAAIRAIKCGMLSGVSHGVPKTRLAIVVGSVATTYMRNLHMPTRGARSTALVREAWLSPALQIPNLNRYRVFDVFKPVLREAVRGELLGLVWVPDGRVKLGYAAGKAMGEYLLSTGKGLRWLPQDSKRSPMKEIARLICHRLQKIPNLELPGALKATSFETTVAVLKKARKRMISSLRRLHDSFLG
eukprot:gnl/TRDRNA2_/TRDRNA2_168488_c0_seq4.p1 gnl/TRDRNA2_/TRDRNA2_168488_c0~~gnl/TRDRNA2_/TRDRNA2_168488_c0_seq4.p1  ORF type:complete len:337 (-),score=46.15 gnl/TRDRNA2_/TRDRNA2_168488_c0_seq4:61-1071(-)